MTCYCFIRLMIYSLLYCGMLVGVAGCTRIVTKPFFCYNLNSPPTKKCYHLLKIFFMAIKLGKTFSNQNKFEPGPNRHCQQIMLIQIRGLLQEPSDLGQHYLLKYYKLCTQARGCSTSQATGFVGGRVSLIHLNHDSIRRLEKCMFTNTL